MSADNETDVKRRMPMSGTGEFELRSEAVGALPVINHFLTVR